MRGAWGRRAAGGGVAALGLAVAGVGLTASPAVAAACSGTTGVTVVVQSPAGTSTSCAPGDPSSALGALTSAGYGVTYPQMFPGTVVCRINGYPSSDPCVRMPPGSAYWAFFHASRGGSWAYSGSGVASYNPPAGSVVGFRFGAGSAPSVAPPAATPRPAPKPTTTPKPPTRPSPHSSTAARPRPTSTSPGSTAGPGKATARGSATTTPRRTTTAPSATTTAVTTSPSATSTTTGDLALSPARDTTSGTGGSGSPLPVIGGGVLVVALGAGAAYAARRRRLTP